ncbi:MAG: hypothetical protein JWR21_3296 [Herminiimonas sp.]|nr:hypothetical protein [Herminiimonas sp.]
MKEIVEVKSFTQTLAQSLSPLRIRRTQPKELPPLRIYRIDPEGKVTGQTPRFTGRGRARRSHEGSDRQRSYVKVVGTVVSGRACAQAARRGSSIVVRVHDQLPLSDLAFRMLGMVLWRKRVAVRRNYLVAADRTPIYPREWRTITGAMDGIECRVFVLGNVRIVLIQSHGLSL